MSFVHLHRHSEWSLLDGTGNATQYAELAAKLGQDSLAITDHGTLSGVLHHIEACKANGIKPIVGMEAYFKPDRLMKDNEHKERWHLVLLARNFEGWRNLLRLSSEAWASGFYYKPCVDVDLLTRHHEGLLVSASCLSGYVPSALMAGRDVDGHLRTMLDLFGEDFYFEIQPHDIDEQKVYNVEAANLAMAYGVPLVAAVDTHYPYRDWADTHDILVMMNTGQTVATREKAREAGEDYMAFSGDTFFLMSEGEVRETFERNHGGLPGHVIGEAIGNTQVLADRVEAFTVDKTPKIPRAAKDKEEAERIVREWCDEGLVRIGKAMDEAYRERLDGELAVLREKQVLDYFVLIGDMVRWAKRNGVRVGAGRGSAAGSLVSYLCGITAIDPIGHGLLFERFLNLHRAELPDIDIDFQHTRRADVKAYLGERWGVDHVADIIAFQTFGMRSAIQGAARVLNVPYDEAMALTNSLDEGTGDIGLGDMFELSGTLREFAGKYPAVWRHALRLEGQVKAISKHAAGVVVTDKPVSEYMPTMRANDGSTVTAWSEKAEFPIITEYGFLKIDILSTDGLTIQDTAIRLIRERTGREIDFEDVEQFPIIADPRAADQEVIEAFGRGMNLGVFQFESRGINGLLRDIKPTWFGDLVAANALFRPGPIEGRVAFEYGARKNGFEPITYWHEAVKPFLEETYGIMVYQEQVMQIVQALGDFSLAEADLVRKAMTKWQSTKIKTNKGRGEMQKFYDKFEAGCLARGLSKTVAEDIWEKILQFSIYGFNKSHSAGYSLQSYQDKWLKLRYPLEEYTSLLTWETAKVPKIIKEARHFGVTIRPPDINKSERGFTLDGNAIRFGFEAIKHVGDAAIDEIKTKRPFDGYDDFVAKVELRRCNSRVRDSLARAGAFDCFDMRSDFTAEERASAERELLGFVLEEAGSINEYRKIIDERIFSLEEWDVLPDQSEVVVAGEITEVREIRTRAGDRMAFVDLEYNEDEYACTFFPESYTRYEPMLVTGGMLMVKGYKDQDHACTVADVVTTLAKLAEALNGDG